MGEWQLGLLDSIVLSVALILSGEGMVTASRALGPRDRAADLDIIAE